MNEAVAPRAVRAVTPSPQVPRDTLCEHACAATSVRVVVVRAPAGFGKTTAMGQMRERLETSGTATAWLGLDTADNDAARFVHRLGEAVAKLAPDAPQPPAPAELMRRLATHPSPYVLFLDDFERIQDRAVIALVRELIDHLPVGGRVVIGVRTRPDLGLGRLRARGQLLDIDTEDLRFTLAETERYFQLRPHLPLSPEAVVQLHHKTEGWVAALALAAVALQRQPPGGDFIARFSGSNRTVAAYLAEAVLAQQPEATRQFLLRTSILHRLDVSLCDTLVPGADSAWVLERLEADNLFVTALPGEDRTWRYHSLFADFLRARLASEHPTWTARLHLAASGWYEARQRLVPAIEHAIEGGDMPHAAGLLVQHAESFIEQGRMRLLARWIGALPPDLVDAHRLLQVAGVWADCFTRGPAIAMERLQHGGLEHDTHPAVRAHVGALLPLLHAMMDSYGHALATGLPALARLPTCRPLVDIVLHNTMAHVLSVGGDPGGSHRLLEAARGTSHTTAFTRPYTESMEGILDLHEGRLRQAAARFRMAAGEARAGVFPHAHGNAWAGVLHASTVYESGQLDTARHLLNVYQPLVRDVALPDHLILSHVLRSRIAFDRGDIDTARQVLSELEYLGHHRQLPRVIASARLERGRLLLMQGHALASREAMDKADTPGLWERVRTQRLPSHDLEDLAVGRVRWEIAFGDPAAALARLEVELAEARGSSRHRRSLKLRVLKAMAQHRAADIAGAVATLDGALRDACPEGFMRLVIDEGPALAPLLWRLATAIGEAPGRSDPIFGDYLQRLSGALGSASPSTDTSPSTDDSLATLTRQEIRVLQLLAEGYSNGAMAEKLEVSDSTVRTHLRSINLKLNAHSRMQAVAAARRLAVIR